MWILSLPSIHFLMENRLAFLSIQYILLSIVTLLYSSTQNFLLWPVAILADQPLSIPCIPSCTLVTTEKAWEVLMI